MSQEGKKHDVKAFLKDIFTEDDAAQIFDFLRVLSVVAAVVLMGLAIYTAGVDIAHFEIEKVGRAFAEYFVAVGVALFAKSKGNA